MSAVRTGVLGLRTLLSLFGLAALAFVLAFSVVIVRVVIPVASDVRVRAIDLLSDHDAISANLRGMRDARREVARHVPPFAPGAAPPRDLVTLRAEVRAHLDQAAAIGTMVDRVNLPPGMRLLLADAVQQETALGVDILEAIRAVELGRPGEAVAPLRRSGVQSDSSTVLLSAAQRVALGGLIAGEERILRQLEFLERLALAFALGGMLLLVAAARTLRARIYQPIGDLERAVRLVTAGDLTAEVPVGRQDELGRLGAHMNAMTAILRERADEESRHRTNLAARFGRLLDESSNEICVFDAATLRAVQANRGARENLGYARDEIGEISLSGLLRGHDQRTLSADLDRLRRGEAERLFLTTRQTRKDGSTYPVEMTVQYSTDADSAVFVTVSEDAGIRERARELDGRLRDFAMTQPRVLGDGDPEAALQAIVAMVADALRVRRVGVWRSDGEGRRCLAFVEAAPGAGRSPADLAAVPYPASEHLLAVEVHVAGRARTALVLDPGDAPRTWSAEEQTFVGAAGGFVARALDAAERRLLEQALARAQRMDSIGQLAGGVAHDFNNILTAILGNLEAARLELAPGDPIDGALAEAELAARRAADLTRQLLTFARNQPVESRVFDLNTLARDADKMLQRLVGVEVQLRTDLEPALHAVRLGVGQFEQVLVNLVVNARDAMPEGGRVTISTRNVTLTAAAAADHPGLAPGPHVELAVHDTGQGMSAATREHIFDPFFTTKAMGEGTGLGLAVCYGIVQQARGEISVTSEEGRGTTFRILLPAVMEPTSPAATVTVPVSATGSETILVVEDERPIRELIVRSLQARGYRVLQAPDGQAALDLVGSLVGPLDLLVTDVVMPHLGGPETARLLRTRHPDLPVIFMSGYTADALSEEDTRVGAEFLAKPFTPDQLCQRVRSLLDARAASPRRAR